jgi:hypothetical protein
MSAGIGAIITRNSSASWHLIDPEYADILRSLYGLSVVRDGKAYFQSYLPSKTEVRRIEGVAPAGGQRETFRT